MSRKILIAAAAIVLLVGGAVFYLASSLDGIVKGLIEKSGSAATGTAVSVSSVEISLRDARASVDGLTIANPSGFSGDAISFGKISVAIDPDTISNPSVIHLKEVRIGAPSIRLVAAADGQTNLQALQANLKRDSAPAASEPAEKTASGQPIRLRIDRLEIGAASLEADLSAVGGKAYETKLPVIRRSNLGGAGGASPDVIARAVAEAIVSETVSAVARSEASQQLDKLIDKNLKGDAGNAAKGLVKGLLGE